MVLAIEAMGTTIRFVFFAVALAAFVAAGIGINFGGKATNLVGLGLAAVTFPTFWDLLADL